MFRVIEEVVLSLDKKQTYHGTRRKLKGEYLNPSRACWTSRDTGRVVCERDSLVFATKDKVIAIAFAAGLDDFAMFANPFVLFVHNSEEKKLDSPGYLLSLDKKDFSDFNELTNEYTTDKPVKIQAQERIVPRKKLEKMGVEIYSIPDTEPFPTCIEDVKKLEKKLGLVLTGDVND